MKKLRFGKAELDVSPSLLSVVIKAFMSLPSPTVADISRECGASLTSVSKIMKALTACGLAITHTLSPGGGQKASKHFYLNRYVSTLVLDISYRDLAISVISGEGECIFSDKQIFDPLLGFEESLGIFLSRCKPKLNKCSCGISSICVIHSDKKDSPFDKTTTDSIIGGILGVIPSAYLSESQAIAAAIKFNSCQLSSFKDTVAYIYFGDKPSVICIPYGYPPISCPIGNLFLENRLSIDHLYQSTISSNDYIKILSGLTNVLDSTLSPSAYLIESDRISFGSQAHKNLRLTYANSGFPLPEMFFSFGCRKTAAIGASKESSYHLIQKYISSSSKKQ